eukprot:gnl/MRDRNA2_/MRDRNA2_121831_c0_seq1.p1 gnl/MRDRNA2_/MRDRNA2_121831_c0~~gnl/MRDRNA2_/MRDRNA2_121831_c0_seq1.p1  ORF type:complete len:694 (+),score=140.47 gnl/MRDRNA2_/MRDRNA2_121831_c0_seq1:168-2249(+)
MFLTWMVWFSYELAATGQDAPGIPTYDIIPAAQGRVWDKDALDPKQPFIEEPEIDVLYQAPAGSAKGIVLVLHGNNRRAADMFKTSEVEIGQSNCEKEDTKKCNGLPTSREMRSSILRRGYIAVSTSSAAGEWGSGSPISPLDSARIAKAVQHVMDKHLAHDLPVFVIGVQAGRFMAQMLKPTQTQMPDRLLAKAELKKELLPSIHKSIKCFAPQLSALQVAVASELESPQKKGLVRGRSGWATQKEIDDEREEQRLEAEAAATAASYEAAADWNSLQVRKKEQLREDFKTEMVAVAQEELIRNKVRAGRELSEIGEVQIVDRTKAIGEVVEEKGEVVEEKRIVKPDPLGDCLKSSGWAAAKVDQMSDMVKRGFVSKKLARHVEIDRTSLLAMQDDELAQMCMKSSHDKVAPLHGALSGPSTVRADTHKNDNMEQPEKFIGTLADCLMTTGWSFKQVDKMNNELQRKFVSKKVSTDRNIKVTELAKYSDDDLASMCPVARAKKVQSDTDVEFVTKLVDDLSYPPTIFVHMPRDSQVALNIAKSMCQLRQRKVRTAEVQAHPKRVTLLSLVKAGFSEDDAKKIIEAWTASEVLNSKGFLYQNPEIDDSWLKALDGVRNEIVSIDEDTSVIDDVVRMLYAASNMIAEHTSTIIDFCEGKDIKIDHADAMRLERRFLFNSECKLNNSRATQVQNWI